MGGAVRMITLNQDQWRLLQASDTRNYVAAVCDEFLAARPEMAENPGRETVCGRMQSAYDDALRMGFESTPHIVQWMYLVADAPAMLDDQALHAYLRRSGATPEQRLDDLFAVMKNLLDRKDP